MIEPINTVDMHFTKVPIELRDKFKSACALNGITMQDKFIELIQSFVLEKSK